MYTPKQICIYFFQNFEVQQGSILAQGYLIGRYLRGNREGLGSAILTVVVDSIKQLGEWQGQGLARIFFGGGGGVTRYHNYVH